MLADEKSKQVFDGWLEYRITGRIQPLLRNQTDKAEGYEILDLGGNETYADLGAYNGDTITEFLEVTGGQFNKIFAMEPDGKNYAKMKRIHYKLSPYDFRTVNAGAWSCDTVCEFISKGGRNSSLPSGKVWIKGEEVNIKQPRDAIQKSVALLTEDRRATGIMGVLSVADNIS
ncbi:methyltransferase, FkbM family, partial [human gut metagenome]